MGPRHRVPRVPPGLGKDRESGLRLFIRVSRKGTWKRSRESRERLAGLVSELENVFPVPAGCVFRPRLYPVTRDLSTGNLSRSLIPSRSEELRSEIVDWN